MLCIQKNRLLNAILPIKIVLLSANSGRLKNQEILRDFDRQLSNERAIKSFLTWLEGWNVFDRVTAYLYPEIAHQLFAFQDQIHGYNQNSPPELGLNTTMH